MSDQQNIEVLGARVHNLKNISVTIPRHKLTVITGLSGSGKSSLAFDTIFAEGQRRYIDTFSSYARGYIGNMQRPDVDQIKGLSPVISIDQKTTGRNPRSTVGTVTEVYDYLRLLYARAGVAHSYVTGEPMVRYTDEQIAALIAREYAGQKILLLAPLVNNRKGHYKELFETIRKKGYVYVRVDGEVQEITQGMRLDRYKNHTIEVVIDRLKDTDPTRLRQSIDKAMTQGNGMMAVATMNITSDSITSAQRITSDSITSATRYFSRTLMDPATGISYREPAPHSFSFNSPSGWCPCCKGLGRIRSMTPGRPDEELTDAIHDDEHWFERLVAIANGDNLTSPKDITSDDLTSPKDITSDSITSDSITSDSTVCPECQGQRLCKESLSYRFAGKTIAELSSMDLQELYDFLSPLLTSPKGEAKQSLSPRGEMERGSIIAAPILKEILTRLQFMLQVGLSYLSLDRSSTTLSGGESQRIRLATQIGSRLVNVLYILDEPSIGLHQRDNERLIASLKQLRDMGNTVIVVEHDEEMMRQADWIVDIGPRAGRLGGEVVFQGTPAELLRSNTLTAQYLRGEKTAYDIPNPLPLASKASALGKGSGKAGGKGLLLSGCTGNNLKDVSVEIPLGKMVCVTGVSGSGKSTLINQTLYPILSQHFYRSLTRPLPYTGIEGLENIDKVIAVDQSPIGRTPRSNPATYTNVFTDIRELFAQLPEARIRNWKAGRFSFNAKGGRCEECAGNGYKTISMHFMPDVIVDCESCHGQRYNRETEQVRFKGKSIGDVLNMTVNQAVEFFDAQPTILRKIKTIQDVGLGYIRLGQSSTTLSGGESQRIKLATELSRPSTGRTLYILDEPTTGLHFEDIRILLGVLRMLVDKGNTVLIIEHNMDVIRACDWLIDLGPDGGRAGGQIVAVGTQDDLRNTPNSLTGRYL